MLPAGFEPAIPVRERPHTHALHRAATEIGPEISIRPWTVCDNIAWQLENFWSCDMLMNKE